MVSVQGRLRLTPAIRASTVSVLAGTINGKLVKVRKTRLWNFFDKAAWYSELGPLSRAEYSAASQYNPAYTSKRRGREAL